MAEGGFAVKFDGKVVKRCYAVAFDYDAWTYTVNTDDPQPIPKGVREITLSVER